MTQIQGTIEKPLGASRLGQGANRIRATLNVEGYPVPMIVEATKISPVIIERFKAGGAITDEQLDMIAGFLRGEYSLSGIDNNWRRIRPAAPEVKSLPLACTDLPVGPVHPHPLGDYAPERVPQDALPTLVDPRLATPTPARVEPGGMFGIRRRA